MIAMVDYGMGNRRSVEKALAHVGFESVVTADVRDASAIVLPGVGAFPEAMRNLERTGLGEAAAFYHVHSLAPEPANADDVVGRGEYGQRFVSIVERGNVMGCQFHPEKSSRDGLALLRNFISVPTHPVAA